MNGKILKGSIIAIILIAFLIAAVSAETNADEKTTIQTLSKGGLVIHYPSDWAPS